MLEYHPPWYQEAVFYEVSVRAFYDSNSDGVGDIPGLIEKLDYLQWLGIGCIWLLPIFSSPRRDDGYDISDYYTIQKEYGTIADVTRLLEEAHKRGIRVIADLVLNHTSDQHVWFQESRKSKDSVYRNWYIWSNDPNRFKEARVIFKDTESSNWAFDDLTGEYYFHRFFTQQPDLNYDNPEVQEAMLNVALFWLEQGFDGFRLDAVPFLFKREGTSCENLPEVHTFLKYLRREIDKRYPDRLLLAEAVMQPSDLLPYFGDGDECHMCFNFPVTNQLFRAFAIGQGSPVIEAMQQTLQIPDGCQWQIFLRNHDALILSIVPEEQAEVLIAAYAPDPQMLLHEDIRRRLTPLLGNDPHKMRLIHAMLFSLPGSPILYYGDEIGMGDDIHLDDRYGLRTPMQWSIDLNAGFSLANPDLLYLPVINSDEYGIEKVNVAAQVKDVDSFLCWLRRIIEVRRSHPVLSLGNFELLDAQNPAILAFVRQHKEEILVCINNFSDADQIANLNLQSYVGVFLYDVLENIQLPENTALRYNATLPPYGFVWLQLKK